MAIPTDRGYVVLTREDDGTTSVVICTDLIGDSPRNPYAMHPHRPSVSVDRAVELATSGKTQHTTRVVEVCVAPDGTVRVRSPRASARFLDTVRRSTSFSPL